MKICVIGTGYVGLVAGTCLAEMGNDVVCVDNNEEKIKEIAQGNIPIYEPGLEELIKVNTREGRLLFTTDLDFAVKNSLICFIAVGTPQGDDGSCDLKYVFSAAEAVAKSMNTYKVIVNKSTVPVGTAEKVKAVVKNFTTHEFDVVSNPEFLKQGAAVDDFLKPDRVIIGSNSQRATEIMQEVYSPFLRTGNPIIIMDVKSAEMSKYAANSFLATKISFINELANICEKAGANIEQVRIGMSTDRRIGSQFLFPGLGYGGSCFPKDVKALIRVANDNNVSCDILAAADKTNFSQRKIFIDKILDYYKGNISGKTFALWGLAFKPRTNDMREAPAITIIEALLSKGASVKAYDPKAMEEAKRILGDKITYSSNNYDVLEEADALILATEWNEFRRPDYERVKKLLKKAVIFDGRNQYDPERMYKNGFDYICIGKSANMA
ncbi:MAG TPA: UDP-glucose/GDP-mannose dehydrogenase family protein, partial [Candidatus Gastranaerophilales bacterium]|nr:UDP-glucose/GDP-mannose dehydrogenase family protein [Candidatus Gastranaerophilales bacterium]